jgi:hypothetical protein
MTQALKITKLGRVTVGNRFTHRFWPDGPEEWTVIGFMPKSYVNRVLVESAGKQKVLVPLSVTEQAVISSRVN